MLLTTGGQKCEKASYMEAYFLLPKGSCSSGILINI